MALINITYFSTCLARQVQFQGIIPNDAPNYITENNPHYTRGTKTLYLLHGYSGNSTDWLINSSINDISLKYNLAVILPSGENSFYVDSLGTGRSYGTYIGEELVDYVRKTFNLSINREDTFIGGFSMGGFGAIRNGLNYNNTFSKILSISSALIINDIKNLPEDFKDPIADFYYYQSVFGNLNNLDKSQVNPEYILSELIRTSSEIPKIKMICGDEDFLLEKNRSFRDFLDNNDVEVIYNEYKGNHTWEFCDDHLEELVKWVITQH